MTAGYYLAGAQAGMSILGGISEIAQARAQADTLRTQGFIRQLQAEINADLIRQQAKDVQKFGRQRAAESKKLGRKRARAQRASFAGQGVVVGTGTAAQVQAESETIGELDAITIMNNARRAAAGLETEAIGVEFGGEAAMVSARAAAYQTLAAGGLQFARSIGQASLGLYSRYGGAPRRDRKRKSDTIKMLGLGSADPFF